jgi:hypothetical protein
MEQVQVSSHPEAAEFEDALDILDELHVVMSRLKRLRLVDDVEHLEASRIIDTISSILTSKLAG